MTDPRKRTDWKRLRREERLELLLGAILDALTKELEAPKQRRKVNA